MVVREYRKWLYLSLAIFCGCFCLNADAQKLYHHNFSRLFVSHQEYTVGFIDNDYWRFYIHFDKIRKDTKNGRQYYVTGKTKVRDNICSFQGTIKISSIKQQSQNSFILTSEICLMEDRKQKGSGMITGRMTSFFYIKNNRVAYDDRRLYSDSYFNNSVVGEWKSYKSQRTKPCCWGNYRIPHSGDLDIGAGEFQPNDKYIMNGWQEYATVEDSGIVEKKWW